MVAAAVFYLHGSLDLHCLEAHGPVLGGVTNRVVDEVLEHASQEVDVRVHCSIRNANIQLDSLSAPFDQRREHLRHLDEQLRNVDRGCVSNQLE